MNAWQLLSDHSQFMLVGSTAFLCVGLLLSLLYRAPIQRKRAAEWAAGSCLLFAALTLAPLPRPWASEATATPSESAHQAASTLMTRGLYAVAEPNSVEAPLLKSGTPATPVEPAQFDLAREATPPPVVVPNNTAPPQAAPTPIQWNAWLLRIYTVGASLAAAWLLIGWARLRYVLRRADVVSRREARPLLQLRAVRRRPRLLTSRLATRPFCVGGRKPRIVLPATLWQTGDDRTKRHVIAHECAHLQQRDARGQRLFALLQPLMWFHPLFWWLRSRHHLVTELIADDIAAGQSSKHSYAQDLVRLVEIDLERRQRPRGAVALFRTSSDFYQRIQMLMSRPERLATRCSWLQRSLQGGLSLALLVGATSLGGAQPVVAQEPDDDADAQEIILILAEENKALRAQLADMEAHMADMQTRMVRLSDKFEAQTRRAEAEAEAGAVVRGRVLDRNGQTVDRARLRALGYSTDTTQPEHRQVVVKQGDSLWTILKSASLDANQVMQEVIKLNPDLGKISDDGRYFELRDLKVGDRITLPPAPKTTESPNPFSSSGPVPPAGPVAPPLLALPAPGTSDYTEMRDRDAKPFVASVNLAEAMEISFRYIDLQAELKLGESKLHHSVELAESGFVGQDELSAAKIRLDAQHRKANIARRVIELKIEDYATQLDQLKASLSKEAAKKHPQVTQLRHALELLKENI